MLARSKYLQGARHRLKKAGSISLLVNAMEANIDLVYAELKRLNMEIQKNNALLLSMVPEEAVSAQELVRLKRIKAEMDSGKA